jgi:hypothetical protein
MNRRKISNNHSRSLSSPSSYNKNTRYPSPNKNNVHIRYVKTPKNNYLIDMDSKDSISYEESEMVEVSLNSPNDSFVSNNKNIEINYDDKFCDGDDKFCNIIKSKAYRLS